MSARCERFDVGTHPSLGMSAKSGAVEVRVGADHEIVVELDADDADRWSITRLGDSVTVEPPPRSGWRVRPVRGLITVPRGADVDLSTASADVQLNGELGAVRVKSASGDVRAATAERLEVQTASGDAAARTVASAVDCSTASGDVEIGSVGGRLTVNTASGDVTVATAADDVEIGSASGDIRIDRFDGSDIRVKCISGDVQLGLPAGIRVEPDITTLNGRTTLPEPAAATGGEPRRVVRVALRTVTGDISIRRV